MKMNDSSIASQKLSEDIGVKYQVLTDKGTSYFAVVKKKNKTGNFTEEILKI